MLGETRWTAFQTEQGMLSGPRAEESEDLSRDEETSSFVSSEQSQQGRRIEARGAQGQGGKRCPRRAWFIALGVKAPGRLGKWGAGEPASIFLTPQIERGVAEKWRDFQWAFFAALMALK